MADGENDGLLANLGLRRKVKWDYPTIIDEILDSPLQLVVVRLYHTVLWFRGDPIKLSPIRPPIRIVCLSDTHEEIVQNVPPGDLLIHAGDLTTSGSAAAIQKQLNWLASLPHRYKVVVPGNHDYWFDINSRSEEDVLGQQKVLVNKGLRFLHNTAVNLKFGGARSITIQGAAWSPRCGAQHAYAYEPDEDQQTWNGKISRSADILVTHAPPKHHLDLELGSEGLLQEIWRTKPTVHVFGHVHCGRGTQVCFWDDTQKQYERLMSRERHGLLSIFDVPGWLGVLWLLWYGLASIAWQWLMEGGRSRGSILVNAGCQDGIKKRLTKKSPLVVEL